MRLAALLIGISLLLAAPTLAQDKPKAKGKGKRSEVTVQRDKTSAGAEKGKGEAANTDGNGSDATAAEGSADAGAEGGKAGVVKDEIRKEGDTEVKVMEFSGLDVEGQLKTPQMLYFLNRLRAEFGRPRLPHRSFMPELQRSAQDGSLK